MDDKPKNCPNCTNWWFNRQSHGCSVDPSRITITSSQVGDYWHKNEKCKDYNPIYVDGKKVANV